MDARSSFRPQGSVTTTSRKLSMECLKGAPIHGRRWISPALYLYLIPIYVCTRLDKPPINHKNKMNPKSIFLLEWLYISAV